MPHDLNVVLIAPEIPPNTGNIGRLCLATGSTLHLVKPLGFELSDAQLKRAGLDYWEHLNVRVHEDVENFFKDLPASAPRVFLSKKAGRIYYDWKYEPGTYLIFGRETSGLSDEILNRHPGETVRIPLYDARVRSLNLSNAVGIVVYEAIRQLGA